MYFKIQFIVHAIIFYIIIIEEILFGNSASTLACIKAADTEIRASSQKRLRGKGWWI